MPAWSCRFLSGCLPLRVSRGADGETLQPIAWFCMSQGQAEECLPWADMDESFRQRPAYQEGYLTDEPDLSIYDEPHGLQSQQRRRHYHQQRLGRLGPHGQPIVHIHLRRLAN